MKISCIYIIKSKIKKNKIYIGSAVHFLRRKNDHTYLLINMKHKNVLLQNHFNKYGIEDLYFEIIERIFDLKILLQREQYYIDLYNPAFNICRVAGSPVGTKKSPEQIAKMVKRLTGRIVSEETRNKLRLANLGKKISEEQKLKLRNANTGKTMSDEAKLKMGLAHKGVMHTEAAKLKISLKNSGKKRSDESKMKMRNSQLGKKRPHSIETKKKIGLGNKGKKLSEDHKKQISEFLTGRKRGPISETQKQQISKANSGKKFTLEHRLKLSDAAKKRVRSDATSKKISIARKGIKIGSAPLLKGWETRRRNQQLKLSA